MRQLKGKKGTQLIEFLFSLSPDWTFSEMFSLTHLLFMVRFNLKWPEYFISLSFETSRLCVGLFFQDHNQLEKYYGF